jgi:hypothetical protein
MALNNYERLIQLSDEVFSSRVDPATPKKWVPFLID